MNCDLCRERMIDWIDGIPDPDVDGHLAACPECRSMFETARSNAETLGAAREPAPRGTWEDLLRRMERPRVGWGWPAAAAAAAAVVVTGFLVTRREEPPPKRLRIEVVDATNRVEPAQVDDVLDSLEGAPIANANGGGPR